MLAQAVFLSRLFLLFSKPHFWEAACCSHLGRFLFHETFSPSLGPCAFLCDDDLSQHAMSCSIFLLILKSCCGKGQACSSRGEKGRGRSFPSPVEVGVGTLWLSVSHTQSQGQYLPRRFQSHHKADCWLQITASCSPIHKQQHSFGSLRYTGFFFFPLLTYQISDENLRVLSALMDMHLNHKKLRSGLVKCWQT